MVGRGADDSRHRTARFEKNSPYFVRPTTAAGLTPAIVQFPVGGPDADPGFIVPHFAVDRTRFDFAIDLPGPGRSPIEKAHLAPGVIEFRQEVGRSVFGSVYWWRVRPQWSRALGSKSGKEIERSRLDP